MSTAPAPVGAPLPRPIAPPSPSGAAVSLGPVQAALGAMGAALIRLWLLVPDIDVLVGPSFDVPRVDAQVRHFYEATSRYRLEV
jgi:hypothetical protein